MLYPVTPETRWTCEAAATDFTLKRPFSSVHPHVLGQVLLPHKALSTDFTALRFLSPMLVHIVSDKCWVTDKLSSADLTAIRHLSCMDSALVLLQT